jgi:hypothetical protein
MPANVSMKGSIFGKRVFVFDAGVGRTRLADLRAYMRRFSTRDTLAFIGKVSAAIEGTDRQGVLLGGTPVPPFCLPYLALVSIESSNDHRSRAITDEALPDVKHSSPWTTINPKDHLT